MKRLLKMLDREILLALSKHDDHIPIYVGDELIDVVKRQKGRKNKMGILEKALIELELIKIEEEMENLENERV